MVEKRIKKKGRNAQSAGLRSRKLIEKSKMSQDIVDNSKAGPPTTDNARHSMASETDSTIMLNDKTKITVDGDNATKKTKIMDKRDYFRNYEYLKIYDEKYLKKLK